MTTPLRKPEIMSPAGYWPQLEAAIEAGADAVYFGLKHFSARAKVGFTLTELPDVMRTLHRRGVRGYVTFNTVVFDHELAEAARTIHQIVGAGADALIVQDVGIANLAREIAPDAELHGSTQMSITSAEGVELAQRFGVGRVVLARELSLQDIAAIRAQTDIELEMFVHGALCVSYSGQCFSSEAWGGRSANRGQCAQACRLPYELIVDDVLKPLGDARYLLSPGDLYALHQVPDILPLGISSLKIEGRYKDADYVALTTAAYRKAVDEAWVGLPSSITAADELHLEQVYSRGLGDYFISGTNHQTVVRGRSPRHRGVLAGTVVRVDRDRVVIEQDARIAAAPLKAGDGVVFDAANWRSPEQREEGGRLYGVAPSRNGDIEMRFGMGAIDDRRVRVGDWVWRSDDPDIDRIARRWTDAAAPVHKQPVHVAVVAYAGEPLRMTWTLAKHPDISTTVSSPEPLATAQNRALDAATIAEQCGRLGNTAYALAELSLDQRGRPFVPSSLLNTMRREAVARLEAIQTARPMPVVNAPDATLDAALGRVSRPAVAPVAPQLHLLVRTPQQLEAAVALGPASITLDYLELYGLRPAVERVREQGIAVRVASPRVLKPSEQRVIHFLLKLGCPILVRSSGLLHALQEHPHAALVGDFSLNAANVLSADVFLHLGLERLTPSYDLNAVQVGELARTLGADHLEIVAYHHLPVFHTEHCVFCRFLSSGTSYKDCGHPCEQHRVALRDERGREHPVMADVGCRNTVFGAEAQEGSRFMDQWQRDGLRHFRLEFVHETADDVARVGGAFQRYLAGQISAATLERELERAAPQGTTEGSLFVPANYEMIPLMT